MIITTDEYANGDMSACAVHAIRELLNDGGVPQAAFIDDHVGNLVAMYNQQKDRVDALEHAMTLREKRIALARRLVSGPTAETSVVTLRAMIRDLLALIETDTAAIAALRQVDDEPRS